MHSKQILAQNQRIERITPATLVVGVDIAKERHVAQAINFRGIVLTSRASRGNHDFCSPLRFSAMTGPLPSHRRPHRRTGVVKSCESASIREKNTTLRGSDLA